MSDASSAFNVGNDISAQSIANKMIDFWKKEDQEDFLKELIRHDEDIFIVVDE